MRCFFVEGLPSQQVATRFGYSPGAFRVLCHQFRHDPSKRARFFQAIRRGPQAAPARDRVRELAVALRKRNLSVYDIQRELAAAGHSISINALSILLREEGFARLPRRRDEERPATLKPEAAAIADVRQINLAPRSFRTRVGGLFLFVPLMRSIDLGAVLQPPRLPGSQMIPAEQVQAAGLPRGSSFDLDFHTVPANSQQEPLNKHYVSSRSRSQKGILVFLARDATERVLCYANAGVPRADRADEVQRFVQFWHQHTAQPPAELVFDSQLTTYAHLNRLNQQGIRFITLRRRSKKMLGQIWSRPASAWHRITLPALTRIFRTPKVLDERIVLKHYEGPLRQLTLMELGHEEPTVLLTNHLRRAPSTLITRYAQRMLIENGISEAIQFFHLDARSSMVGLKVDFDLQITLMASSLYRLMAEKIGREYQRAQTKKIFRNLLDVSARVQIQEQQVTVRLDKRAHNPYLVASGLGDDPTPMPWFGGKTLVLRFD